MLSSYLQSMFLSFHFRYYATNPAPSLLYFSFHSSKPSATGSNEVTSTYFANRAAYNAADFTAPSTVGSNRIISSNASLGFGSSIASTTVPLPYLGIWDSEIGGNFLGGFQLKNSSQVATPIAFGNGDNVSFASGAINLYLDLLYWSEYARDLQFAWIKGAGMGDTPASTYLGLFTALNAANVSTEITATVASGGRFQINNDKWTNPITVSDRQQIQTTNNIDFGMAIDVASGLSKIGVFDASTGGNLIIFSDTSLQDIAIGQQLLIPAGSLKVSLG